MFAFGVWYLIFEMKILNRVSERQTAAIDRISKGLLTLQYLWLFFLHFPQHPYGLRKDADTGLGNPCDLLYASNHLPANWNPPRGDLLHLCPTIYPSYHLLRGSLVLLYKRCTLHLGAAGVSNLSVPATSS
ncbi:hypothetical protein RU639_008443 [Aspergillus parasiticus]